MRKTATKKKKPEITHVTFSREVKLNKQYNNMGVFCSMTAAVNGNLVAAKKLVRTEVDKFLDKRLKEVRLFINAAAKE